MTPKTYLTRFVTRYTKQDMTLLAHKRLSDLWRLTFFRKSGGFEKSRECKSQTKPETCASSMNEDDDPCPSPEEEPPCFFPKLPTCDSVTETDSRKFAFWRRMSLFVALPVLVIMSVVTYAGHKERAKEPREPFLNLPYMCRRTKPFPWGDGNHTLFHNPVKNPVPPHGYEVEDPNEKLREKAND